MIEEDDGWHDFSFPGYTSLPDSDKIPLQPCQPVNKWRLANMLDFLMPTPALLKRDWQKDHVYLVQFPRAGCIPTASPFAFKLETWLRMANINYTNISNDFTKSSVKGQIPFIELNGRQLADSNLIIEALTKEFHKEDIDGHLSALDKAHARALHDLLEESLRWVFIYSRGKNNDWFVSEQGFIGHVTGVKKFAFKNILRGRLQSKIWNTANIQGIGRLTPEECIGQAKKDIEAASVMLGNKKFFFGDQPVTVDCTAFAHLSQFMYTPQFSDELKTMIETTYPNLGAFVHRMKDMFWPDWDEACSKLSMDTKYTPQ